MATFEIKMPKLGESITEGTIISWSVKPGDTIQEDDILFEVSTAKVSAEIPSPVAGTMLRILFEEGETVPVGTVVALVQLEGTEAELLETVVVAPEKIPAATTADPVSSRITHEDERWYSPVVLQIAGESGLSREALDQIPGSGYLARLTKKDLKDYLAHKTIPPTAPIRATSASVPVASVVSESKPSPVVSTDDEVMEMDRVRRIIADHMVMSKKVSPHVTSVIEVDVTRLVRWRSRVKDAFLRREGFNLTFMPAITQATAKALTEYPQINASVDGYKIIRKKHINIGIAVSLQDGNLIVPVIQDADRLNLNGLAAGIDSLATRARENKLSPDSIQGGTFTITNFGTFKGLFGTPIINQPQVAILAVGYIEKKPAVIETPEGDTIAIRHKMYLSLSYDHRVVDGALGGAFLRRIGDYLEDWKD